MTTYIHCNMSPGLWQGFLSFFLFIAQPQPPIYIYCDTSWCFCILIHFSFFLMLIFHSIISIMSTIARCHHNMSLVCFFLSLLNNYVLLDYLLHMTTPTCLQMQHRVDFICFICTQTATTSQPQSPTNHYLNTSTYNHHTTTPPPILVMADDEWA